MEAKEAVEVIEAGDVIMSVEVTEATKVFHPSQLRLWRTGMLLLTKSKGHKPNGVELGTSV